MLQVKLQHALSPGAVLQHSLLMDAHGLLAGAARALASHAHAKQSVPPGPATVPVSDASLTAAPVLMPPAHAARLAQPSISIAAGAALQSHGLKGNTKRLPAYASGVGELSNVGDLALQPAVQNLPAAAMGDAEQAADHDPAAHSSKSRRGEPLQEQLSGEAQQAGDNMQAMVGLADPNKRLLARMGSSSAANASLHMMQEAGDRANVQGLLQVRSVNVCCSIIFETAHQVMYLLHGGKAALQWHCDHTMSISMLLSAVQTAALLLSLSA